MSRVQATVSSVLNNRHTLFRWASKGFWAVMDQGLFALSNFALNVLLARWLTPADYGAFAVAYTIFLLLGTFHTALITEPMLVFGSGKYKDRFTGYLNVLLRGHWSFTAIIGILFAISGLGFWLFDSPLTTVILGLSIASPFILFQWLMRKACYVNLQPQLAAYAGALYMALMFVGAYGLYHFGALSATTALGVMAASSLLSALWLVHRLQPRKPEATRELARESLMDHWRYGRWAVGTAVLTWIPGNVYYLVLPVWGGLEAAGIYRALLNLLMPILHMNTALSKLLLPTLVKARETKSFYPLVRRLLLLFVATPLLFWLFLGSLAEPLVHLLYGSDYVEAANLLWIAGLLPIFSSLAVVSSAALKALELPNRVFVAHACATVATLTLGLGLVVLWGIGGAMLGWLCAYMVTAGVLLLMLLGKRTD